MAGREMRPESRHGTPKSAPGTRVVLRPGRDKSLRNRHPWIFSGAVESVGERLEDGALAEVVSADGDFLGRGLLNRKSQIMVRVLSFDVAEPIDATFWRGRLERALGARGQAAAAGNGAERLVHAESDGMPGLVVDRYRDFCVVQASSLGMSRRLRELVEALGALASPRGVYERSDVESRGKEGLGAARGLLAGEEPPDPLEVEERTHDGGRVTLLVDVRRGHKTGAYLDQAENRRVVGACAQGAEVLNLFSYTGGFGLHAAAGGAARVTNVDSSADALLLSERIAAHNGLGSRIDHLRGDTFETVRRLREEGRSFDVVVVDPPKLAHSAAQVQRAARAYQDLSRVALHLVRAGGYLATFSCSGAVSAELFQKIVFSASLEARRDVQLLRRLGQAPDHPVALTFPEGEYLKGLFCRVW